MINNRKALSQSWCNINKIVLYGMGKVGNTFFHSLQRDLEVLYIIDGDKEKQGKIFNDIKIVSYQEVKAELHDNKIIVMAAARAYSNICDYLKSQGLIEYKDFCSIEQFVTEWYWMNKGLNCLLEVHTSVTSRCTFKCRNCNMFMPYYKQHIDYTVQDIISDISLLFEKVDYVFNYVILGGEPFLNKDLTKILNFLLDSTNNRIGRITLVTNGSIIPKEDILIILKNPRIFLEISDYTESIYYEDKINQFVSLLKDEKINYSMNEALQWCDFGFPHEPFKFDDITVVEHMKRCSPRFHGLNDGKLYYCHVAWSAEKCGLFKLDEDDYVKLSNVPQANRREIIEHASGNLKKGFCSFCKVCGGCGEDNSRFVKAGQQINEG